MSVSFHPKKITLFLLLLSPFLYLFWQFMTDQMIDPIEEITNPTGIWALRLLLLTLAITPLKALTGLSLVPYRRMIGVFVFYYASLHFLIWFVSVDMVLEDIVKRPYITVGFFGLIGLLLLAVTSFRVAMRRLGKSWKKLHRLVYLIGILALVHFYWQVKSKMDFEPLVYSLIGVVLLAYRWWLGRRQKPSN